MVEWERHDRKHPDEEKSAKAVQGKICSIQIYVLFVVLGELSIMICLHRDQCLSVLTQKSHLRRSLNVQT